MDKRTPAQWTEYLRLEQTPITLDEYIAGCLARILGAVTEGALAAQHTEGMVGAIDQLAEHIATNAGLPYDSSAAIREALDARRDEQRRLAAEQRQQALREG